MSESVVAATDAALEAAGLPKSAQGVTAVLRRLAKAIDDIGEDGLNPAGKLDNVSIPTYLKFSDALGLLPPKTVKVSAAAGLHIVHGEGEDGGSGGSGGTTERRRRAEARRKVG